MECMLVDGADVVRKVAARIVLGMGGVCDGAETGNRAIDMLVAREGMPDVVIVGANLEDMSADEVVRAIRAMPGGDGPKILGLVVESDLGRMLKLKRAGADGFMFKPFTRQSFVDSVEPFLPNSSEASQEGMAF